MWAVISIGAAGLCVMGLAAALMAPARQDKQVNPEGDGLPLWVRVLWPWTLAVAPVARRLLSHGGRERVKMVLAQAGLAARLDAADLFALQIAMAWLSGALGALLGWLIGASITSLLAGAIPAALVGAGWPSLWLRDQAVVRRSRMARELPFALDMATLCIEAGLNLQGALQQAATRGPTGPLRDELSWALAEIRTGVPRMQALRDMATRTGVPGLKTVVASLAQADSLGMSVGPVLRAQAESLRNQRFLRAEKQALEAPVKMLFPLIACIFPCTFLVIGFPILIKLMAYA